MIPRLARVDGRVSDCSNVSQRPLHILAILQWVWSLQTLFPKAARLLNFQQVAVMALPLVTSPALSAQPGLSGAPQSRDVAAFPTKQVIMTRACFFQAEVIQPSASRMMLQGSRQSSTVAQVFHATGSGGFSSYLLWLGTAL